MFTLGVGDHQKLLSDIGSKCAFHSQGKPLNIEQSICIYFEITNKNRVYNTAVDVDFFLPLNSNAHLRRYTIGMSLRETSF